MTQSMPPQNAFAMNMTSSQQKKPNNGSSNAD